MSNFKTPMSHRFSLEDGAVAYVLAQASSCLEASLEESADSEQGVVLTLGLAVCLVW